MPADARPGLFARFRSAVRAFRAGDGAGFAPFDVSWQRGFGLPATFKPEESLVAYDDNVYLHRAVMAIALEGARTEFKLASVNDDGDIDYVKSHQAVETLRLPQPTAGGKSMLTAMDLKMVTFLHLLLNGEAFWHLEKRLRPQFGGAPLFVNPLLPQHMYARVADDGEVMEYVYRTGLTEHRLDPLNVVHFKLVHPQNVYRGNSPVQALRYALDTHKKASIMNLKKLDNSAVPPGVLTSDQQIAESERSKLGKQWQEAMGGVKNAGKVPVMPNGLHFERISESNQDMQYAQGKEMTRDEVLAMYAVGLDILGKTESKTRANAEASIFSFKRFGVLPFLEKFADTLNNDYLPAFPATEGLKFVFDDPVPENMEEKRQNAAALFGAGAMTPDEMRQTFGLEPLGLAGVTDTPYLPINLLPAGSAPPPQPDPLAA